MKIWQLYLVYALFTSTNVRSNECGEVIDGGAPVRAQGIPGKRGMPGVVDYGKVKEMVEENLYEDIVLPKLTKMQGETEAACEKKMNKKMKKLTAEFQTTLEESRSISMEKLESRIEKMFTGLSKSISEVQEKMSELERRVTGRCDIYYDSKCFWMIVHDTPDIVFAEAESLCSEKGQGKVGNIYSDEHYNAVAAYARTLLPPSMPYMFFWIGTRYEPETDSAAPSEGQSGHYFKWRSGYPYPSADRSHIWMFIRSDPSHLDQGMYNRPPTIPSYGVLCQA